MVGDCLIIDKVLTWPVMGDIHINAANNKAWGIGVNFIVLIVKDFLGIENQTQIIGLNLSVQFLFCRGVVSR